MINKTKKQFLYLNKKKLRKKQTKSMQTMKQKSKISRQALYLKSYILIICLVATTKYLTNKT